MLAFPPEFYRLGLSGFVIVIAFCASKLGQEHNPRIRHVSCPECIWQKAAAYSGFSSPGGGCSAKRHHRLLSLLGFSLLCIIFFSALIGRYLSAAKDSQGLHPDNASSCKSERAGSASGCWLQYLKICRVQNPMPRKQTESKICGAPHTTPQLTVYKL